METVYWGEASSKAPSEAEVTKPGGPSMIDGQIKSSTLEFPCSEKGDVNKLVAHG